jgi:hypothetical protein
VNEACELTWYNDITMTKTTLSLVLGAILSVALSATLSGCNSKTSANEKNFGMAVAHYFDKKGDLCLDPIKWPVDVYEVDLRQQKLYPDGVAGQMAALEAVGLARGEDIELPGSKLKVRRYTPAGEAAGQGGLPHPRAERRRRARAEGKTVRQAHAAGMGSAWPE